MKTKGTNQDRMLGGFWLISEGGNPSMGFEFVSPLAMTRRKEIRGHLDGLDDKLSLAL